MNICYQLFPRKTAFPALFIYLLLVVSINGFTEKSNNYQPIEQV